MDLTKQFLSFINDLVYQLAITREENRLLKEELERVRALVVVNDQSSTSD